MTRYSERRVKHAVTLGVDFMTHVDFKKVDSDARTRRYYARQNSTGCFDSALYPESKINYYPTSGHDDSGFMDRESNTPITYVVSLVASFYGSGFPDSFVKCNISTTV